MQLLGLLVFVRLLRELAVPPLPAAGMALLFLFNPAFMNDGLIALSSHFDVLAGVFAMTAFLAAWRERYGVAILCLTLAVFTKELALYAPLAAALSLMIWRRPPSMSALMLLPLPLWAVARFLAYGDVFDSGGIARPGEMATGLSIWPTGLVTVAFVRQLVLSFPASRADIVSAVFLLANIGLWIFLCYAALTAMRRQVDTPERAKLTTGLLVWTLGALSFGVLVGYASRYGGSIYPFLYLFLAALFFSPGYRVPNWVVASVLFVFSVATAVQSAQSVRGAFAWESQHHARACLARYAACAPARWPHRSCRQRAACDGVRTGPSKARMVPELGRGDRQSISRLYARPRCRCNRGSQHWRRRAQHTDSRLRSVRFP